MRWLNSFTSEHAGEFIQIIIANIVFYFVKNHTNNLICTFLYLISFIILRFPMGYADLILMYCHLEWITNAIGLFSLLYCLYNMFSINNHFSRRNI